MKLQPRQRDIRLPKQWLHWAQTMGLKPMGRNMRGRWRGYYMIGRGRCWRVNDKGYFQVSCPFADFDRWANSFGAEVTWLPSSKTTFQAAVRLLLEQVRDQEVQATVSKFLDYARRQTVSIDG